MPQIAAIEKKGIPTVSILFPDQEICFRQAAMRNGVPNIRTIHCSRTLPALEDINNFMPAMMDALTRPLTAEEKKKSVWEEPNPRILFEGTLEEAQEFYQQADHIATLQNAPHCRYTDGLPIVIPTEEAVDKMLTGTSHKPDEVITFHADHFVSEFGHQFAMGYTGKKGDAVRFLPMGRMATVEKIAAIGVMAGCQPKHMPALLAIAESGGGCGDGRGRYGFCISGPYAREIEMNFDINVLGPGNRSNRCLGRAAELMWRNLGGQIPSVNNCGIWGSPLTNVVPENTEGLPPGWETLGEEYEFRRDQSVIVPLPSTGGARVTHSMGGYRAFQKSGHGGMGRRLGVKGIPGPHNFLEYAMPGMWDSTEGGITVYMTPEMALHLYEYGFKTKEQIYEWIYKKSFMTVAEYRTHSWPDVQTNSWRGIERTSGKPWAELPQDYMVPAMNDPYENCVIVTGGGEELEHYAGSRGGNMDNAWSIDEWR